MPLVEWPGFPAAEVVRASRFLAGVGLDEDVPPPPPVEPPLVCEPPGEEPVPPDPVCEPPPE